jgi:multiple sugar transport system ATP-binding protein
MANVVFDHIVKRYASNLPYVIRDLNLTIEDKEFLVLVGPSGCGKSTALRMIAGLEEITDGKLWIGDKVVNTLAPKDRDIAMVFQNYALYPHMTCFDNMAFALRLQKIPEAEIRQRVEEAAKMLEVEQFLDRRPKALSGGQRQRIAIGRAIVRKPKVFLMDEPLSNLDAKLRGSMRAEIKRLHKTLDTTFVYVTHDQTEAMTLGDRIAVMKGGDLQQCASPREVYNHPANLFVATFIGSPQMNLMEGEMTVQGSETLLEGKLFRFVVPTKPSFRNGPVVVGVRPEHLVLVSDDEPNYLSSTVEMTEPMGFETYVYLEGDKQSIICRVPEEKTPELGATMRFTAEPSRIHVFDPATESNLDCHQKVDNLAPVC